MKEFLQKGPRGLYLATAPRLAVEGFDFTRISLDQSYRGWLRAVHVTEELIMSAPAIATRITTGLQRATGTSQKPTLQLCQPAKGLPDHDGVIRMAPTKLTTQDYVQVMLATIREGASHARWPRDVVAHYLAAEVVSESEE